MKSLREISWQVDEPTYREDPAFSYSLLAKYERVGFNGLATLKDKIETPSLTFGSAVDALITGGENEFQANFVVAEFPNIKDSIVKVLKVLFERYSNEYPYLSDVPDNVLIPLTQELGFQLNWKPETRAKVIREQGEEYYSVLSVAKGKTILSTETYQQVTNAVKALKTSPSTAYLFAEDSPFSSQERCYQLKFKATLEGIPYRCMADLLLVDYDNMSILPVDLKTSSHKEWDFWESFVQWNYQIQARLYWRIIRACMNEDKYFENFTLLDYQFVVVNKETLTPLVWEFEDTTCKGDIKYGKDSQILMRDPFTIGKELKAYTDKEHRVPIGINETKVNSLKRKLLQV